MTDPLSKNFQLQRIRAKQRGIPWKLEYWEWLQIWQDSGHLHERGPYKGQWVLSRPGDREAYESGNMRIADNVIEFPIRKRDADMTSPSGWRIGSRKLMPLAA
jgi:hypothetical protein